MNIPNGSGSIPTIGFGYSRPASSLNVPFGYSGTPAANTNIGLGNLQVDSITRPNNYIGLNSFVSVAAHYVIIDNIKDGKSATDNKELSISMLCFARNSENINKGRTGAVPQYGTTLGANTVEVKELTQLNEYLDSYSHLYESADEIASEWKVLGVIKNETGNVNTMSSYGNAPRSRIVNFIVSHRVATFNYWSNSRIINTQKLWLIIKKNNITGKYFVEAWTSIYKTSPGITDLMSIEKPGADSFMLGISIYVGKSSDQTHALQVDFIGRKNTPMELNRSLVKRGLMSTIEIQLGI